MTEIFCSRKKSQCFAEQLRTARISMEPGHRADQRHPTATPDPSVFEVALQDPGLWRLIPLVHRAAIANEAFCHLPPTVQTNLRNRSQRLVVAELYKRHFLASLLRLLDAHRVPVILLKGTAFFGTLYSPDAPRATSDIDLLVKPSDFVTACAILSQDMVPQCKESHRPAYYKQLFERTFRKEHPAPVTVDLHRQLTNPYIFSIDDNVLWATSREYPSAERSMHSLRGLSPEATLLHLAIHAFRDLDFCTHNLLDAHEIVCQWAPDWNRLVEMAFDWTASGVLYYLLQNCSELMQTPIPKPVLSRLRPMRLRRTIALRLTASGGLSEHATKTTGYRIKQLISQALLPDKSMGGVRFQANYSYLCAKDWLSYIWHDTASEK
jgi:hypothetical protein